MRNMYGGTEPVELTGTLSGPIVRGFSAYDLARRSGFEGTVEEWLLSLKADDLGLSLVDGILNVTYEVETDEEAMG